MRIRFRRLRHDHPLIPPPRYASPGASGLDLCAAEAVTIPTNGTHRVLVPTGFAAEIPGGYEGQIRPRSGLALKHGITVLNAPGTIDSDYRGEISVVLVNHGCDPVTIQRGDRIAQMVITPVVRAEVVEVEDLDSTERASGGFGSTGI